MTAAPWKGRARAVAGGLLSAGTLSTLALVALSRGAHIGFVLPLGTLALGMVIAVVAGLVLHQRAR